jgi:hypothetical protein
MHFSRALKYPSGGPSDNRPAGGKTNLEMMCEARPARSAIQRRNSFHRAFIPSHNGAIAQSFHPMVLGIALVSVGMILLAGCHRNGGSDGPEVLPKKYPGMAATNSPATGAKAQSAPGVPSR